MSETVQPKEIVSLGYVGLLKNSAIALAIVVPILYLPFLWFAFEFEPSPYSGVFVLSPAFAICNLIRVPFFGPVVCIAFLALAYVAVSYFLTRSRIWLIVSCLALGAISTESSREIYHATRAGAGYGLQSTLVEGTIIKRVVWGSD